VPPVCSASSARWQKSSDAMRRQDSIIPIMLLL
jgi:hypothetical protein